MNPLEIPRKVVVILTNQPGELSLNKSIDYWKEYVLPVFVAGALDYDLILIKNTLVADEEYSSKNKEVGIMEGKVHEYVKGSVFKQFRDSIEEKYPKLKSDRLTAETPVTDSETSNFENGLSDPNQTDDLASATTPQLDMHDIIAIGRNSYAETLNGLSDGLTSNLDLAIKEEMPPQSSIELHHTDSAQGSDNTDLESLSNLATPVSEISNKVEDLNHEEKVHIIEYDKYRNSVDVKVPSVGYLPFFCYSGWGSIPIRIFHFFNDTENFENYTKQALQIVLEKKRPFNYPADLDIGSAEEKMNGWEDRHAVFVVSPNLTDKLDIYDTC
ncbi:Mitochondrial import inner membrane translocase subunit tim54 [Smittium mucronatum]|uniref:Mitochondrial import inner membrane translocase subunit TIM54 n=1 Tax=Smittium mucronatum TaxID=133383 RepID=A0A1R0GVD6_9FUNG|nr:Mitochondrial import inner membrane translocase subunit tim54 [Smittium mucronatum]